MIRIDKQTRKLQVKLSGAVATNQLPIIVSYVDRAVSAANLPRDGNSSTVITLTSGATPVDICLAPSTTNNIDVREIDSIDINNIDTAAVTLTLQYVDNATTYSILTITMAVGDKLTYGDGEWQFLDKNGSVKTVFASSLYALLAGSSSQAFAASDLTVASINSGPIGVNQNIVMNGDMRIDQLNEGAAVTPTAGPTYFTDRFFIANGMVASKLTFQRVADAPAGLVYSLKITVAAQYAPAAGDVFALLQRIEGAKIASFSFGNSGALSITLFNWIKGSVAGNYSVALRNAAGNRSYLGTIAVTTSWSQVVVHIAGDASGTWPTDNTLGMLLSFDLGSGSTFQSTAGSWQAGNLLAVTGNTQFVNQVNGSTLNITGVGLVPGSVAPTYYPVVPYEVELARCQRYVEKSFPQGTAPAQNTGNTAASFCFPATVAGAAVTRSSSCSFKVTKNGIPTVTTYSPSAASAEAYDGTGSLVCTATAVNNPSETNFAINTTGNAGTAVGNRLNVHWLAVSQL